MRKLVMLATLALAFSAGVHAVRSASNAEPAPSSGHMPFAAMPDPTSGAAMMLLDAQSRSISFQALLTNDQGNPIPMPNGQHELDFRLYDNVGGGVPIGEVLDVLVTLDNGVASTQIGPLDPAWFDGTARWLGVTVDNGDELTPLIPLSAAPYAFRVDRVASAELDNNIELGDDASSGSLVVRGAPGTDGRIGLYGNGQLMETRNDAGTLVGLYGADAVSGGGACLLGTAGGTTGLLLDGEAGNNQGGYVALYDGSAAEAVSLVASSATIRAGSLTGGPAGNVHVYPAGGAPSSIHLDGETGDIRLGLSNAYSGDLRVYSAGGGTERIHLSGAGSRITVSDGTNDAIDLDGSGKSLRVFGDDGQVNARLWGPDWGELLLFDADGSNDRTVSLSASSFFGDSGGALTLFDNEASSIGVSLVGGSGSGGFGWFYNDDGEVTVNVDGDLGGGGGGILMSNSAGTQTVEIDADESNSAVVRLDDSSGATTVVLDASPARIGIGTASPDHELVVQGDDPALQIRDDTTDNSENAARLELLERAGLTYNGGAFFWWNGASNKLLIGTKENGVNTNVLVVDRATQSVGIGTQTPGNFRLAVNGAIRAKEIVVETGWSDFVFEPDYRLRSLDEVEAHIQQHGHLPDIPSAKEVETHGVKVGEMESKLLQKIEELTLHMIAMDKRVKSLEAENARLRHAATMPPEGGSAR